MKLPSPIKQNLKLNFKEILKELGYEWQKNIFLGAGEIETSIDIYKINEKSVVIKKVWPNKEDYKYIYNYINKKISDCNESSIFVLNYEIIPNNNYLFLKSEYFNSNLYDYFKQNKLDNANKINIICQLIYAINCIHKINIKHGDIKPHNFFIKIKEDNDLLIKIADFDDSGIKDAILINGMTPDYIPINVDLKKYKQTHDIFSLGLVFLYVLDKDLYSKILDFNRSFYLENRKIDLPKDDNIVKKIINNYNFKNKKLNEIKNLTIRMLTYDDDKRINTYDLYKEIIKISKCSHVKKILKRNSKCIIS